MNRRASVFSASSTTARLRSLSSASVIVASFLAQPGVLGSAACNGIAAMGSCASQDASFAYSASSSYSHGISQADESAAGLDPFFYDVILPALAGVAPNGRRRSSTFTASTTTSIYFASSSTLASISALKTNAIEPCAKRMRLRSSSLSSYPSMLMSACDASPDPSTFDSPATQSSHILGSQSGYGGSGTARRIRIGEDPFAWDAANMQGRDHVDDVETQSLGGLSTQPSASTLASGISSQASAVVRPLPKRHRDSHTVTLMRARAKALRAIDPAPRRDDTDVLNERAMQAFYTQQKLIDQGWAPAMARGIAGLIVEQGLAGRVAGDPMSYLARTPSTIDVQPPAELKVPIQRAETFGGASLAAGEEKGSGWGAKVGRMLTVTRKIVKKKSRLHVCEVFDRASS